MYSAAPVQIVGEEPGPATGDVVWIGEDGRRYIPYRGHTLSTGEYVVRVRLSRTRYNNNYSVRYTYTEKPDAEKEEAPDPPWKGKPGGRYKEPHKGPAPWKANRRFPHDRHRQQRPRDDC